MRTKQEWVLFNNASTLESATHFFLVGIGGTGMAPLAEMLQQKGFKVRGSNREVNHNTLELEKSGITVHYNHQNILLNSNEQIIFSDAIFLDESPEFHQAKSLALPVFRRMQVLNWILKDKKIIAVTGTHGKTTTSGMIATALDKLNLHPSYMIGSKPNALESSSKFDPKGDLAVVETCEAYDSMHDIQPDIILLLNLEPDHLDYHKSYESLESSMLRFIQKLPENGVLVYCGEDAGAKKIAEQYSGNKIEYHSMSYKELGRNIPRLNVLGDHNLLNHSGALKTLIHIGTPIEQAESALLNYTGARRRMEVHLDGDIIVMDDYAHHPTEISETIKAIRSKYPERRLIYTFQPQLYSRTRELKKEFGTALSSADIVVITDIFPSREKTIPGVSSVQILPFLSAPHFYIPCRHILPRFLKSFSKPGDLFLSTGVGNIGEMSPILSKEIQKKGRIKVAVLYGGDSTEREISLLSGEKVKRALLQKGYDAFLFDVTESLLTTGDLSALTGVDRPDLLFIALHGTHAEDGSIQGLCQLLHIPYTHSPIFSSSITMNKHLTKTLVSEQGILTPKSVFLSNFSSPPEQLSYPMMVKANAQGSTIGITKVTKPEEYKKALREALIYDSEVLVEEYIEGIEITVPVLNGKAMPTIEIIPHTGSFDFDSKYTPGATLEISPARIPEHLNKEVMDIAEKAHAILGCKGLSRSDFILKDETFYYLETNTIPGMTETSLTTKSATAMGLTYEDLCDLMAKDALYNHHHKVSMKINAVLN